MEDSVTNGELPSSQFLSHLTSYPFVLDSVSTFKENPYGQKFISVVRSGFSNFVKPYLPYFAKPYGYVATYVAKADSLGEKCLSKVDEKFLNFKEETDKVKTTIFDYVHWPFKLVGERRAYLFDTHASEYEKCRGDGYVANGKAVILTALVIASELLAWLSGFCYAKAEETDVIHTEKTSS